MLFRLFLKNRLVLIMLLLLCLAGIVSAGEQGEILKFDTQGKFKIVQLTDIHWKSDSLQREMRSLELIAEVLDAEKPQLVVLTGDIVTMTPASKGWQLVLKPIIERKIPWAAVLGNHEGQQDLTRKEIIAMLQKMPDSLVRPGPKGIGGCGNFDVAIKNNDGSKDEAVLFFLDSNAKPATEDYGRYDWIRPGQINWYRQKSLQYAREKGGRPLPSLMFFHIPIPEYKRIWKDKDIKCVGAKRESVCCPSVNSGMFAAIWESQDVMGVFVGHDHNSDYAGCLFGICLAYGRVSGYDAYGSLLRGARVIELIEGRREFNSWIRTEKGEVVQEMQYPTSF